MRYIFVLSVALIILAACSKDNSPTLTDEQIIEQILTEVEGSETDDFLFSNIDEESENNFIELGSSMPDQFLVKQIKPIRFGRIGRPVIRNVRIVFTSDTTATVHYMTILKGEFRIIARDTSMQDSLVIYRVNKPMTHEFERIAHFVKRGNNDERRRGWRLYDFSMAKGVSVPDSNKTVNIVKVQYWSPDNNIDTTIINPLEFFQSRENVFTVKSGTEVTITVYIENSQINPYYFPPNTAATELVRLHHGLHRKFRTHRLKYFHYIGPDPDNNNVYEGTWTIGNRIGIHHAVIDVIDNGTIFDDDEVNYPYNSETWGTPYRVKLQ